MIILPNKYERYTAALRNSVQASILKQGLNARHIESIRKIYEAEAFLGYKNLSPVNLEILFKCLLYSANIKLLQKKRKLDFTVQINGNYLANRKLLTCLILNICSTANKIKIYFKSEKIVIECKTQKTIKPIILKLLNAIYFYDIKAKQYLIVLKLEKTEKDFLKTEKEWDITNPFSPINIYLI